MFYGGIVRDLKIKIWERDEYTCQYCGKEITDYRKDGGRLPDDAATVDHILPQSKGGCDLPFNLVSCCFICNQLLGHKFDNFEDKEEFIKSVNEGKEVNDDSCDWSPDEIQRWEDHVEWLARVRKDRGC